jgi:hypothetical protein
VSSFEVLKPFPNVLFFEFESHKEMLMTMFRIQEYYESPFDKIRNNYFTVEQFIDAYMEEDGELDYFAKWGGFNVPGHIVKDFFFNFRFDLTDREKILKKGIEENLSSKDLFYIIATRKGQSTCMNHELAHALYYLDEGFKNKALGLVLSMPSRERDQIHTVLAGMGYTPGVFDDEIQAYLSTSEKKYLKEQFKINYENVEPTVKELKKLLKKYLK